MVGMVGWMYIIFWIFTDNHIEKARYSRKACISGNLHRFNKPQYFNEKSYLTPIQRKLGKVRKIRYTSRVQVIILTQFFSVTKDKT